MPLIWPGGLANEQDTPDASDLMALDEKVEQNRLDRIALAARLENEAAMRAFSQLRTELAWSGRRHAHYGWGRNVGVIGVSVFDLVVATRADSAGTSLSSITLLTPTVAPTGTASFAQDETGTVIIGTSTEANQRIWRSLNGGITWTEVLYPSGSVASNEVLVTRNRFNGHWFILRNIASSGVLNIFRSTNDGATWTLVNTALPWAAPRSMAVTFDEDGRMFVNFMGALNSTYVSTNNGTTFANAFAPGGRYVHSLVEWQGRAFALGHRSDTTLPYVAEWDGIGWVGLATAFAPGPVSFTRFSTTMPGMIVALAVSAFGISGTPYWMASRDGGATWRVMPIIGTGFADRYQSPSPGGIHVMTANVDSEMTLATLEV